MYRADFVTGGFGHSSTEGSWHTATGGSSDPKGGKGGGLFESLAEELDDDEVFSKRTKQKLRREYNAKLPKSTTTPFTPPTLQSQKVRAMNYAHSQGREVFISG